MVRIICQCIDLVVDLEGGKGQLTKIVLPLCYKLLDETKSEVKIRSEKLTRTLHSIIG